MRREQKLITDTNLNSFETTVNKYLRDDWEVVPGTMSTAVAAATSERYNNIAERAFAVVIVKTFRD
jgi:hypothetical protein